MFECEPLNHMAPLANKDGRKVVELFLDASSVQNANRVKFQMCPDTVLVRNKRTIASLLAMENAIVAAAVAKSRDWFKKELTEEQVRLRFKSILTSHPEEPETYLMKIKVK